MSGVVEKSSFKSFARKGEKKVRKSSPQKVIVSFGVFDSVGLFALFAYGKSLDALVLLGLWFLSFTACFLLSLGFHPSVRVGLFSVLWIIL